MVYNRPYKIQSLLFNVDTVTTDSLPSLRSATGCGASALCCRIRSLDQLLQLT